MADNKRISQLNEKTSPVNNDLVAIVDTESSPSETKKLTLSNLIANLLDSNYVDVEGDTMSGRLDGHILTDTKSNILGTTPNGNTLAYATDTERFYVYDGSDWQESAIQFSTNTSSPNMGVEQNESRQGYGSDYIADKVLSYIKLGTGADDEEGAIRRSNGVFQIYLNGVWNDVVINFVFREDSATGSYELEHQPVGLDYYYEVMSGNSNKLGIDGKPIIQQYTPSMGAEQPDLLISGGSF